MAEPDDRALFFQRVRDLVRRPLVSAAPDASASDIAGLLSRERIGSVVIVAAGRPIGIVTDPDLRRRVVEPGRDPARTPASAIMSAPLVTLAPAAFAFDALLAMTRHGIRHVVITEGERVIGVVSSRDLLTLQVTHPVTLARDITRAPSVGALAALAPRITDLIRHLLAEGGTVHDIAQLVAELNDRMVVRVLDLAAARLAAEALARARAVRLAGFRQRGPARADPADGSGQRPRLRRSAAGRRGRGERVLHAIRGVRGGRPDRGGLPALSGRGDGLESAMVPAARCVGRLRAAVDRRALARAHPRGVHVFRPGIVAGDAALAARLVDASGPTRRRTRASSR